jgi:hypothetical protein
MRALCIALVLATDLVGCASTPSVKPATPNRVSIPKDILARKTCQEDIVPQPETDTKPVPFAARPGDTHAYVVISYKLDGSGKAVQPKVIYSPLSDKLFEKNALDHLKHTRFTPGVIEDSCAYLQTYTLRPAGTLEIPIDLPLK